MKIYRKRYIPDEIVDISNDEVLYSDEKMFVTKWKPINKRNDIGSGISCVFFENGWKISKFFDNDGNFIYWYCDIIDFIREKDKLVLIDLLVDVKIKPDGDVEILDEDELEEAYSTGLITISQLDDARSKLKNLLQLINNGEFPPKKIENYIC